MAVFQGARTRASRLEPAVVRLAAQSPWLLAPAMAIVLLLAGLAALAFLVGGPFWAFNPDAEGTAPAAISAGVLVLGGLIALGAPAGTARPGALRAIGVFLLFMSADEALTIHEHLQALTAEDWQTLYRPVMLAGAVAWAFIAVDLRRVPAALVAWFAGAASWAVAMRLEQWAWHPDGTHAPGWQAMSVVEETLELFGSACWVVALLIAVRALPRAVAVARATRDATGATSPASP
jgi:hypothetical protein